MSLNLSWKTVFLDSLILVFLVKMYRHYSIKPRRLSNKPPFETKIKPPLPPPLQLRTNKPPRGLIECNRKYTLLNEVRLNDLNFVYKLLVGLIARYFSLSYDCQFSWSFEDSVLFTIESH